MQYPKHVAIIPDGNRTRAKANNKSIPEAYWIAYERGVDLMEYTFTHTDTKVFTLRGLSTENTKNRPKEEFDFLMTMYKYIDGRLDQVLMDNQINFKWIGNPNGISDDFKKYLDDKTAKCTFPNDKYMVLAINYGGRDEILRGVEKLAKEGYDLTSLKEEDLTKSLDLGNLPNIELVIRTKGDEAKRTSGFMSRWIGYAELYFTPKKCPEFDIPNYQEALNRFNDIAEKRNFGK